MTVPEFYGEATLEGVAVSQIIGDVRLQIGAKVCINGIEMWITDRTEPRVDGDVSTITYHLNTFDPDAVYDSIYHVKDAG